MRVQPNEMVSLGYGRYVRSDDVTAIEPIVEGRGPKRRALVWVRGLDAPLVSSRSEESLIRDLTSAGDQTARLEVSRQLSAISSQLSAISAQQSGNETPPAASRRARQPVRGFGRRAG